MARVTFHVEQTDDDVAPFVWWADSDDLPGFYAAADDLVSLRTRVTDALAELGIDGFVERFAGSEREAAAQGAYTTVRTQLVAGHAA